MNKNYIGLLKVKGGYRLNKLNGSLYFNNVKSLCNYIYLQFGEVL